MKFLNWCVGAMQILTGFMLAWSVAPAWRWVWIAIAVFWFFAGAVIGTVTLAKLVAGKVGAGAWNKKAPGAQLAPAPKKEE